MGKNNNKIIGTGVFAAVAASLCCIAPLFALFAGVGSLASAFDRIEPLRPYLIGIAILALGLAWYQNLKPKKEMECECETDEKKSFMQSKTFLVVITIFAVSALSFPYYSSILFASGNEVETVSEAELTTVNLDIEGMTCEGCQVSIANYAEDAGAVAIVSDYHTGNTMVKFYKSETNIDSIVNNIRKLGYKVSVNRKNEEKNFQ